MTLSHPQVRYCCETCGQPIDHAYVKEAVERDGLELIRQTVSWDGHAAKLHFAESEILRALMLHSRRSMEALIMTIQTKSSAPNATVWVHVTRLRNALKGLGAPFRIKSLHGWGYELLASGDGKAGPATANASPEAFA